MLPRFFNTRFLLALPFAIVADLLAAWADRIDTKHAGALGGEDYET